MSDLPKVTQRPGWPLPTRCAAGPHSSCLQILMLPVPGRPALALVTATPGWPSRLPGSSGGPSSGPTCASLQYMEKLSQLAYHPLKMQSCYEKMEPLRLDGLQQRFDVSSTSVFKQRAQILMREVSPGCYPSCPRRPQLPISWGRGCLCGLPPQPPPHRPHGPHCSHTRPPRALRCSALWSVWTLPLCPPPPANSDSSFGSQRPLPPGGPSCSLSPFPQGPGPLFP